MYKIKTFFKKLKKACRWWLFMMHETPWQESDQLLRIIEKQLLEMANEFDRKRITQSTPHNARRMCLATKLFAMYREEHYRTVALDKAYKDVPVHCFDLMEWYFSPDHICMNEGWSTQRIIDEGYNMDQKALALACKILSQNLPGWWQ